jgi:hypothetical protein
MGVWRLRGVRGNTEQGVCNKEEGRRKPEVGVRSL